MYYCETRNQAYYPKNSPHFERYRKVLVEKSLSADKNASQNHCKSVCETLEQLHRKFRFKCISDKKDLGLDTYLNEKPYRKRLCIKDAYGNSVYNEDGTLTPSVRETLPLTPAFINQLEQTIKQLGPLIDEEAQFLMSLPDYSRMLNSKIYSDFVDICDRLANDGYKSSDGVFSKDTITHSSISNKKHEASSWGTKGGFELTLYNGQSSYDDGYTYYNHYDLLSGKYRELSLLELSILSVILQNHTPKVFHACWGYHISESSEFIWYLYPSYYITRNTKVEKPISYDIY